MAFTYSKGKPSVAAANTPSAPLPPNRGNAHVGSNAPSGAMSSGKMAGGNPHVNLGTTRGNHSVAHAVKGKSGSGQLGC